MDRPPAGVDLSYGGKNWGNFIEVDGLNTGRFLDPPEFTVFHDKGNEQNIFDRIDYRFTPADSMHLNLNYSRSWFQTPNAYDNLDVHNVLQRRRQRQPHLRQRRRHRSALQDRHLQHRADLYAHHQQQLGLQPGRLRPPDDYNYYPSNNPLADLGPESQTSSISQNRTLTNAGVHSDFSYAQGHQQLQGRRAIQQTFLRENDNLGVVDPTYNAPCVDASGNPLPATQIRRSAPAASRTNPNYLPVLAALRLHARRRLLSATSATPT